MLVKGSLANHLLLIYVSGQSQSMISELQKIAEGAVGRWSASAAAGVTSSRKLGPRASSITIRAHLEFLVLLIIATMSVPRSYGALQAITRNLYQSLGAATKQTAQKRGFGATHGPGHWICSSCLQKAARRTLEVDVVTRHNAVFRRALSISTRRQEEQQRKPAHPTTSEPIQSAADNAPIVPDGHSSTLPSHTESERGPASKRLSEVMDSLLARASLASQRINNYTGTDYSGIEAIRSRIIAQEQSVRDLHNVVETSRTSHREAHSKQSGAQKEIVSLLERKSSWLPADLERYMSLVRSEHTMEQDVATAKDDLAAAERDLEGARSLLERLERKQYHEEQIWSDTIRRNSTWVTFGLMGVNIVLLLAQILIFEPYRRRKIVREVKVALDEKAMGATEPAKEVEKVIDQVVEPAGTPAEVVESTTMPLESSKSEEAAPSNATLAVVEVLPEEAIKIDDTVQQESMPRKQHPDTWSGSWEAAVETLQDMFSERVIEVKKVDLTTMALQGAATGVAAMGLLFVILRPR